MSQQPQLGVCYYPEHWPESDWAADARDMRGIGIHLVRIAEFAWSRIEPRRDCFQWDWLDLACETLARENLQIILCTPTACPPKWLLDECPEIYPVGPDGHRRGFGSRRHYCFSSPRYREEARRISAIVIDRYAEHPAVVGWQTDNEFGCHGTTLSYSPAALAAFREWLAAKYGDIDSLNESWGTVFWSQEYGDFAAVELPTMAVTELNPAHRLDFQRFSSDQVCKFNAEQARLLRARGGGRHWITHNFMGASVDFDHFKVAADLDLASWDSYPLGFLDQSWLPESDQQRYRQTGHPDWAAFHHDLYRGVGRGRFAVMEQQPGPVNWARSNATPLKGMVRLWSWEAIAHGAEFVSYFRWRQAPFAQEQMHSGLQRVDGSTTEAAEEVHVLAGELDRLTLPDRRRAFVALVFDYESMWMSEIQRQASGFDPFELVFEWYGGLRRLGIDVDVVAPNMPLRDYKLIVVPHCVRSDQTLCEELLAAPGHVLFGPRAGSKTSDFRIPATLPPGCLQARIALTVTSVDSIRDGIELRVSSGSETYAVTRWLETIDTSLVPHARTESGVGIWYGDENTSYVNAWVCDALLGRILRDVCAKSGVEIHDLPIDVRRSQRDDLVVLLNYGRAEQHVVPDGASLVLGNEVIAPADLAVWRRQ